MKMFRKVAMVRERRGLWGVSGLTWVALTMAAPAWGASVVGTNAFKWGNDAKLSALQSQDSGVVKGASVVYTGSAPHVVVSVSPAEFPTPSFEVDNVDNPTLYLPAGSDVHFTFINSVREFSHSMQITRQGPPYGMELKIQPVLAGTSLSPVPTGAQFAYAKFSWQPASGTYYYLCVIPGHAAMGMYGKIIAR